MYSLFVGLTFFLFASSVPRGERENIHLLMRAVINSEQAHPSLSPFVSLSLSLCPSDGFSRCLSLPISSNFLPLSLTLCQSVSLSQSFPAVRSHSFASPRLCPHQVYELLKKKKLCIQLHISFQAIFVKISFHTQTPKQ